MDIYFVFVHSLVYVSFSLIIYKNNILVYYVQLEQTKKIKGRTELVTYDQEHEINFKLFVRIFLLKEQLNKTKDPYINYLKRYIKESGF